MILVYALAPASARPPAPLRVVRAGRIGAIVRDVRRPTKSSEAALRAHHRVLTRLHDEVTALLPARFGTAFADDEELRLVLRARADALGRALRHVRGRAQMTVRFARSHPPNPKAQSPKPKAQERSGAEYLRARAATRALPGFEPLRAAVRRWVKDERVENYQRMASVYHLVPRGSAASYRRSLQESASAAGVRVLITGPFPPYAFASPF